MSLPSPGRPGPLPRRSTSACTGRAGARPQGCSGSLCAPEGPGQRLHDHGGRRPCPSGWADAQGPPPTPSPRLDTQRARHRRLPIHAGPRQVGLAQSCPQLPMRPMALAGASPGPVSMSPAPPSGAFRRGRRLTLGGGALSLRPPCPPYPGNLCQVCVHVLVADLHHLSDPLVVAAGERVTQGGGYWKRGAVVPRGGPSS